MSLQTERDCDNFGKNDSVFVSKKGDVYKIHEVSSNIRESVTDLGRSGSVFVIKTSYGYKIHDIVSKKRAKYLKKENINEKDILFEYKTLDADILKFAVCNSLKSYHYKPYNDLLLCNIDHIIMTVKVIGKTINALLCCDDKPIQP